jgi:hypothetical protein
VRLRARLKEHCGMDGMQWRGIKIVEQRGSHLLLRRGADFGILERRDGSIYQIAGGAREAFPNTPLGMALAIGQNWGTEAAMRAEFDEITNRGEELAQKIW